MCPLPLRGRGPPRTSASRVSRGLSSPKASYPQRKSVTRVQDATGSGSSRGRERLVRDGRATAFTAPRRPTDSGGRPRGARGLRGRRGLASAPRRRAPLAPSPRVRALQGRRPFIGRSGKRIAVTVAGFAVLLVGLAGLVLPVLPGESLIFAGLGILATEYVWAQRLLNAAKAKAAQAKDAVLRKKQPRRTATKPRPEPWRVAAS